MAKTVRLTVRQKVEQDAKQDKVNPDGFWNGRAIVSSDKRVYSGDKADTGPELYTGAVFGTFDVAHLHPGLR